MADKMRWRYGETNPVLIPVNNDQPIEIGDCVYQSTDDVRQADQVTWEGLASTQEAFVDYFVGVAMQRSATADTDPIRIATSGTFEFACAAATFEVGDLVGMDDNAGGTALENQKVIAVTSVARAIGRVARRYGSNTTSVMVRIESSLMTGGVQAGTASA